MRAQHYSQIIMNCKALKNLDESEEKWFIKKTATKTSLDKLAVNRNILDDECNVNKNQRAFFMIFPNCTTEDNTEVQQYKYRNAAFFLCVAAANHQHRFIQAHLCVHLYLYIYIYPNAVPFSISNCTQSHGRRIVCIMVSVLTHSHKCTHTNQNAAHTSTQPKRARLLPWLLFITYIQCFGCGGNQTTHDIL